jgi:site-specific recombinase XerD
MRLAFEWAYLISLRASAPPPCMGRGTSGGYPIQHGSPARPVALLQGKTEGLVFGTRNGTRVSVRNFERDLGKLGRKAPPICTPTDFATHFGTNYIRAGGSLEYLRRLLGHASIQTAARYLHLDIGDLKAVHELLTPLSGGRKGGDGRKR